MTRPLPGSLSPGLLAGQREEVIEALRAYIRQLDKERASAGAALRALVPGARIGRVQARPDGTYAKLRAYLAQLRKEGHAGDITPGPAAEWMLTRGWVTAAPDPQKAAAQAMGTLARWGELVQVRYGRYRDPLAVPADRQAPDG